MQTKQVSPEEHLDDEVIPASLIPGLENYFSDNVMHENHQEPERFGATSAAAEENQPVTILPVAQLHNPQNKQPVAVRSAKISENLELRNHLNHLLSSSKNHNGILLKSIRENLGVSLDEIHTHTKISLKHLEKMEADDFKDLPALAYYRGFIASYLKYLGFNDGKLVDAFTKNYDMNAKNIFKRWFRT